MLSDSAQQSIKQTYIPLATDDTPFKLNCERISKHILQRNDSNPYNISCLNAKHNPDMIVPGGTLKGNMYFRDENKKELPSDSEGSDYFHQLTKQTMRYF